MKASVATVGLSIEDVCERYNVTRWTVHRWIRVGWLKATKVGGRTYFTPQALTAFEHRKEKR